MGPVTCGNASSETHVRFLGEQVRIYAEPMDERRRTLRVEAAAHLLVSTRLPLPGVAERCGFGTVEALRQAFGARFGVTPSEYRARQSSSQAGPRPNRPAR